MRVEAALLLLAAAALAEHAVTELDCPPQVSYRVVRDLDGDGLEEVLVLTAHQAWVWRGREGDAFPRHPDARLDLPRGAALFDVGPPEGPRQHVVVRTPDAYWTLGGAEPARLPFPSGPGLPPATDNILWRGFYHDLDADGRSDFVDVSLDGYRVAFAAGGAVTLPPVLTETVDSVTDAASEPVVARYALADWTSGDFDGDGRADFAVITTDGLMVYPGTGGGFATDRGCLLPLEEAAEADLLFEDFNGDLRTDVLAMHRKEGRVAVLVADPEKGLFAPRRLRLAIPGHIRLPVVEDLDADGRKDIAFPYTANPSVQDLVRVALRGEAILKVPIFRNRGGDRPFGRLADRQLTIPIRVRIGSDAAGRISLSALVVVEYGADLDGDGRTDLLITLRPDLLGIHPGEEGGIFAEESAQSIPVPDCGAFDSVKSLPADLNGDGRDDVVLHYRGAGRRPDRLFVLLSRKE